MDKLREQYFQDNQFRALVDMMEAHIHHSNYSPSEMRQAAMLASINYEMKTLRHRTIISPEAEAAMQILDREVR